MATDDERRRVAAALRWLRDSDLPPWVGYTYEAVMGYMPKVGQDSAYHEHSYKEYVTRLADLIEPSDTSQGCRDTVACDREALLALADGIVDAVRDSSGIGIEGEFAEVMRSLAQDIRELCGEAGE